MRDAVDARDFPVGVVEAARVADRERADERGVVRIGDAALDLVREARADTVDAEGVFADAAVASCVLVLTAKLLYVICSRTGRR